MSRLNDMSRLHDQIQAGRRDRMAMLANLNGGANARRMAVGAMREANRAENNKRSRNLMETLSGFMANLAMNEKGRRQMEGKSRKARLAFIRKLGRDVASLARDVASTRNANRTENAASRAAWHGVVISASGKRTAKSASQAA